MTGWWKIAGFAAGMLAGTAAPMWAAQAASDVAVLPAEPTDGEWLHDTLEDSTLWFDATDNLFFEPVDPALPAYGSGRRWVGVVDGRPAWVIYYVPGELLGFEADTHHFAAGAVDFQFFAGADFRTLAPVAVDTELVEFQAKWLRLYHAEVQLPAGTRFLMIRFPDDAASAPARLTEVWLRCRLDDVTPPLPPVPAAGETPPPLPPPARTTDTPAPASSAMEPMRVHAIRYQAPELTVAPPDRPVVGSTVAIPFVASALPQPLVIASLQEETSVPAMETAPPPSPPPVRADRVTQRRGPRSK